MIQNNNYLYIKIITQNNSSCVLNYIISSKQKNKNKIKQYHFPKLLS